MVEPTVNLFPQAQITWASGKYVGWIADFIKRIVAGKWPGSKVLGFCL